MAVISARIDDQVKIKAESIAESIGLPLSSVLNIFLRRFIAEEGFPFDVVAQYKNTRTMFDKQALVDSVITAVKNEAGTDAQNHLSYLDPKTNQLKTEEF